MCVYIYICVCVCVCVCVYKTDSLCRIPETNTTSQINYTPIKMFKKWQDQWRTVHDQAVWPISILLHLPQNIGGLTGTQFFQIPSHWYLINCYLPPASHLPSWLPKVAMTGRAWCSKQVRNLLLLLIVVFTLAVNRQMFLLPFSFVVVWLLSCKHLHPLSFHFTERLGCFC